MVMIIIVPGKKMERTRERENNIEWNQNGINYIYKFYSNDKLNIPN